MRIPGGFTSSPGDAADALSSALFTIARPDPAMSEKDRAELARQLAQETLEKLGYLPAPVGP